MPTVSLLTRLRERLFRTRRPPGRHRPGRTPRPPFELRAARHG